MESRHSSQNKAKNPITTTPKVIEENGSCRRVSEDSRPPKKRKLIETMTLISQAKCNQIVINLILGPSIMVLFR